MEDEFKAGKIKNYRTTELWNKYSSASQKKIKEKYQQAEIIKEKVGKK